MLSSDSNIERVCFLLGIVGIFFCSIYCKLFHLNDIPDVQRRTLQTTPTNKLNIRFCSAGPAWDRAPIKKQTTFDSVFNAVKYMMAKHPNRRDGVSFNNLGPTVTEDICVSLTWNMVV